MPRCGAAKKIISDRIIKTQRSKGQQRRLNLGRNGAFCVIGNVGGEAERCCHEVRFVNSSKSKGKGIAVNGSIPWHSYGVSLAIWDHTVLPATQHKWTHPALIPAMQAGTRFTYPGRMEGWVDLYLISPRPGVEPATLRSRVRRPTTAPPRQHHPSFP